MANRKLENIHQVDADTFIVGKQAVVSFAANNTRTVQAQGTISVNGKEEGIIWWGEKNTLPDERELLIKNNNIVPQLIKTQRNIVLGGGLMAYREEYIEGEDEPRRIRVKMPEEIQDWLDDNEIETKYLPKALKNLIIHGNIFSELIPLRGGDWQLRIKDCKNVRAAKQNSKGEIPKYFLNGNWAGYVHDEDKDETKPYTVRAFSKELFQAKKKCLAHVADELIGGPYYWSPAWEGATTWIKVANCIPEFHLNNLKNGYTLRYIIKVPQDYFINSLSESVRKSTNDPKELAKHESLARKKFLDNANEFFAGEKNAGRSWITSTFRKQFGQKTEYHGIEIETLDVDLKDDAMLKLFESSNSANTSSHGTPPALAGIATGAKMTSGSEIRNLYNFYQTAVAPFPRKLIMIPINLILKDRLKAAGIKLGFIDTKLETTDLHRNGTNTQNSEI